ncbi:MAG: hydrogenase maturation protease [Acidobacteriota bacterium]
MRADRRVLIVGFGNRLAGDDGAGPEVVRLLHAGGLPPAVRAEEGGSDSLRLPGLWEGEPRVWLVDAVDAGALPGTIHRLAHDEVLAIPQKHATVHLLSLPESLRWIGLSYPEMKAVRYRLWGIEPERVALGADISSVVAVAVLDLAEEIRASAAALAT